MSKATFALKRLANSPELRMKTNGVSRRCIEDIRNFKRRKLADRKASHK